MADQLQQARERLIHVTRLASWQALARKMAHEVKNSLTPIRLTMEEIVSRRGSSRTARFWSRPRRSSSTRCKRWSGASARFREFASEPPVMPGEIDVNALVEERISFLKSAHPEVIYKLRLAPERPTAVADPDLIKGVLTNLLENAAEAARPGGVVLASTSVGGIEIEHRSARFRSGLERAGAVESVRADHFVQERRHGPGTFDRAPQRAAVRRRYSGGGRRIGRRGVSSDAGCRAA